MLAWPAHAQSPAQPGAFDYYVLALSWSPEHCARVAGAADKRECGRVRYGFLVHGLWPQHRAGGWPERCGRVGTLSRAAIARNDDLFIDEKLLRHQWAKHGTCTGLDLGGYLDTVRAAREAIKLPEEFLAPESELDTDVTRVRAAFAAANPGFTPGSFAVKCRGRRLAEVRICLTKTLGPETCGAEVHGDSCRTGSLAVRPLF